MPKAQERLTWAIRDTKTRGLTGPIHIADIIGEDHGNFFKLIFDTGKRQTQERK